MKEEKIQTLHPNPEKTNKSISLKKYNVIKESILSILKDGEPTPTNATWYKAMEPIGLSLEDKNALSL